MRYEHFLNDVLREDLRKIFIVRDKLTEELAEIFALEITLEKLIKDPEICSRSGMTSQIDLGCNFYVTAKIPKSDFIFMNVGLGFYAELTFSEASTFARKKIKLLETRLEQLTKSSARIKAQEKLVLEALGEIQGIAKEEKEKQRVVDF